MSKPKKKRGRPPLNPGDSKSVLIPIRVTPEEAAAIQKASEENKKPRSAWIRGLVARALEPEKKDEPKKD